MGGDVCGDTQTPYAFAAAGLEIIDPEMTDAVNELADDQNAKFHWLVQLLAESERSRMLTSDIFQLVHKEMRVSLADEAVAR